MEVDLSALKENLIPNDRAGRSARPTKLAHALQEQKTDCSLSTLLDVILLTGSRISYNRALSVKTLKIEPKLMSYRLKHEDLSRGH
jgi:hypothetical protein